MTTVERIQRTLDQILSRVEKPARYTGGELNSIVKDWRHVHTRVALAFPDVYEIGMSNLGLGLLYDILNRREDVLAERVYAPWPDMEAELRRVGLPLYALESRRPLGEFDLIGFGLGYELTYTNLLNLLDLAGIPLLNRERDDRHPIITAGGSCATNPEPLADFVDLFVIGDGEEAIVDLVDVYQRERLRDSGPGFRQRYLRAAAELPGVYAPDLYAVSYNADGTVGDIVPTVEGIPSKVVRRMYQAPPPLLTRPVVPYLETVHDRGAVELLRGCTAGCRFCQAGYIYRPVREHTVESVVQAVDELIANTGYEEVSLVSLSSCDHPQIKEMLLELAARWQDRHLTVTLPSLRVDSFSIDVADAFSKQKKTGVTFAPEAGTQRLRDVINKGVTEEDVLTAVESALSRGWSSIKLYFMVGLPTETLEDVQGIVDLARKVYNLGRKKAGHRFSLRVGVSTLVPKPHTPFQWIAQATMAELEPKHRILQHGLRAPGLNFSWNDPRETMLEGLLSRGDRKVGAAIYRAWQLGCRFDAWSEHVRHDLWAQACRETGIDPAFYNHRERPFEEFLPWQVVDVVVRQNWLKRELERSRAVPLKVVDDCRYGKCLGCGLQKPAHVCHYVFEQIPDPKTKVIPLTPVAPAGAGA